MKQAIADNKEDTITAKEWDTYCRWQEGTTLFLARVMEKLVEGQELTLEETDEIPTLDVIVASAELGEDDKVSRSLSLFNRLKIAFKLCIIDYKSNCTYLYVDLLYSN